MTRRTLFPVLCGAPITAALPAIVHKEDTKQKVLAYRRMVHEIADSIHDKPLAWKRRHGLDHIVSALKEKHWNGEFESLSFTYVPKKPYMWCKVEINDMHIIDLVYPVNFFTELRQGLTPMRL